MVAADYATRTHPMDGLEKRILRIVVLKIIPDR